MASSFARVLEREVQHWPGADVEISNRRRSGHKEARVVFGGMERRIIMAGTPSDHRAAKNNVAQLKRELKALGAQRLDRPPVSRREVQAMKTYIAPARLAVTDKIVKLLIPTTSPYFNMFSTKGGKPRSYWAFSLLANPDPKGQPFLVVERRPDPVPGRKHVGLAKGCMNVPAKAFMLSVSGSSVEAITKLGSFGVAPIKMRERTEGRIVFYMPENKQPIRTRKRKAKEAPQSPPEPQPEPEVVRAASPAPEPAPAPDDRPMTLQLPKEPISLERAVNVINSYKKRMGGKLRLELNDQGHLRAFAKLGAWD